LTKKAGAGKVIATIVVGLFLLAGLCTLLVCGGAAGGAVWMIGNGPQYEVSRLIHDDCEQSFWLQPDEDGGLDAIATEYIVAIQESQNDAPMTAAERKQSRDLIQMVVPTTTAACAQGDHWVVATNPSALGRMWSMIVNRVGTGPQTAQTVNGHSFSTTSDAWIIGAVDGTLLMASDMETIRPAVAALLADAHPPNEQRTRVLELATEADAGFMLIHHAGHLIQGRSNAVDGDGGQIELNITLAADDAPEVVGEDADPKDAPNADGEENQPTPEPSEAEQLTTEICTLLTETLDPAKVSCRADNSRAFNQLKISADITGVKDAAKAFAEQIEEE